MKVLMLHIKYEGELMVSTVHIFCSPYRHSCRPHSAPAGTGAGGLAPPSSVSDVRGGAGVLVGVGGGWHGGAGGGGGYGGHARGNGTAGPPLGRGYQAKSTAQVWRGVAWCVVVWCGALGVVFAGKLNQLFLFRPWYVSSPRRCDGRFLSDPLSSAAVGVAGTLVSWLCCFDLGCVVVIAMAVLLTT